MKESEFGYKGTEIFIRIPPILSVGYFIIRVNLL